MTGKRFIMNAGRTTKQGQQINIGKDSPEYKAIVGTLTMHPEDMQAVGIVNDHIVSCFRHREVHRLAVSRSQPQDEV